MSALRKKRRRRWLLAVVVAIAAVVAGGVWWSTRDQTATVHYLTATASTGTISDTVEADFTLASDGGVSSISLSGGSSSTSGSTSSGTSTTAAATGSTGAGAAATVFAGYETPSPSPTPSASVEPTSTPSPTPSGSGTPTPAPTGSGSPVPTPIQTADVTPSGQSGGLGTSAAATSGSSSGNGTASTAVSSGISGVVTHLFAKEGTRPHTLQRLLTVSGKGVFAFVSPTPLWKDLSTDLSGGEQRANVSALQRALKKDDYFDGAITGTFTSATESAYKHWQADHGMSRTGVVDVDRFVWMPDGSIFSSWSVTLGSRVSGGAELASVSAPSELEAQALVSQGDLGRLEVGQKAQMTIDGFTDEAFTGVITSVSDEPASSSSSSLSGSSSGSTQYTITIRPQDLPRVARSGMTGTLQIVIEERSDVLLVPTSAVSGTAGTSFVRVMQNGTPVVRQVETGMATSASTEIAGGLTEGETVVTGQYTDGGIASSGTNTTNRSSGLGNVLNGGGADGGALPGGLPEGGPPMMQGGGQ